MKVLDLFKDGEALEVVADGPQPEIEDIVYDSRKARPGTLFAAIKGYKTDGHRYIAQAAANGAAAVLCETIPDEPAPGVWYVRVADSRHALGTVSDRFFGKPSEKLVVTGVTGTNGKTSTTSFIKDIFEAAGVKSGLVGTIENKIGDEIIDNKGRTTPESYDVQELLNEMAEKGCGAAAMECSSHALYLDRVNGTNFSYGIFTNLTQDHLDFHGTMENYYQAKKKLFDQTTKANIVNTDADWGKRLYNELQEKDVALYSYGLNEDADFYIKDVDRSLKGSRFTVVTPETSFPVELPFIGDFMAENALAASIPALLEGVDPQVIARALAGAPKVEGRMDLLDTDLGFEIVIDYAHSPDSLEKLLKAVRSVHGGRIIVVFGANGDRDKGKRKIMGEVAGANADYVVVTSDNPASEDPQAIIDMVVEGVREKTDQYETVLTRPEGVFRGAELCGPGDVLVLAGKGHEKQEILKDETLYYNEWDTAREAVRRVREKQN